MNPSTLLHFRDIPAETLRYFRSGRANACSIYDIIQNVYSDIYDSYPYEVQRGLAPPDPAHNSGVTYGDLLEAKRRVAEHHGRTLEEFLADEERLEREPPLSLLAPPPFPLSPRPDFAPITLATLPSYFSTLTPTGGAAAMAMDDDMPMPERTVSLYHSQMADEEELAEMEAQRWMPKDDWPAAPSPMMREDDILYENTVFQYRAGQLVRERGFPSFQAFWSTVREGDTIIYTDTDGTQYHYMYQVVHRSDNDGNSIYTNNFRGVEGRSVHVYF